MRELRLLNDISVCENAHAIKDPAVQTREDFVSKGTERCPVFDECLSGRLLGPGKLNCIPRVAQDVARYARQGGVTVDREMKDFRQAPFFPPQVKGFIDPYQDPDELITDKEEICRRTSAWAAIILTGKEQPVPAEAPDHCSRHKEFDPQCADCRFARQRLLDTTEVVVPNGIPMRVPRDKCRCPILKVGDFCPVHGG